MPSNHTRTFQPVISSRLYYNQIVLIIFLYSYSVNIAYIILFVPYSRTYLTHMNTQFKNQIIFQIIFVSFIQCISYFIFKYWYLYDRIWLNLTCSYPNKAHLLLVLLIKKIVKLEIKLQCQNHVNEKLLTGA